VGLPQNDPGELVWAPWSKGKLVARLLMLLEGVMIEFNAIDVDLPGLAFHRQRDCGWLRRR